MGAMAHASAHAPFGSAVAWAAAEVACESAGLDVKGARLIRLGENALFHLPGPNVVVRVARSMAYWEDVGREVAVARWLADHGFPAVRAYPGVAQPAEAAGRPVTFWEFVEGRNGNRSDVVVLAELLSRLHRLPHPQGFTLPADNPLGRVRRRLEMTSVTTADKEFLLARLEAVPLRAGISPWLLGHAGPENKNPVISPGVAADAHSASTTGPSAWSATARPSSSDTDRSRSGSQPGPSARHPVSSPTERGAGSSPG